MKQGTQSTGRNAGRRGATSAPRSTGAAARCGDSRPALTLVAASGGARQALARRTFEQKLKEAAALLRRGLPASAQRLAEIFGDLAVCAGQWAAPVGAVRDRGASGDAHHGAPRPELDARRDAYTVAAPRLIVHPAADGGSEPRPAWMSATEEKARMTLRAISGGPRPARGPDATGDARMTLREVAGDPRPARGPDATALRTQVHFAAMSARKGDPVGEWLLIPFGEVQVDRPLSGAAAFEFTRRHAESAKRWFDALGRKLAIDYEHQMFGEFNTRPDGLRPAAGWIGGLEVRDDGLWAVEVTWTPRAAEMLRSGEYRYFSPVIFWTDEDHSDVAALGPVALTNDPAMRGVAALAAGRAPANGSAIERGAFSGESTLPQPVSCKEGSDGAAATKPTAAVADGATGATAGEDAETSTPVFPRVVRIAEASEASANGNPDDASSNEGAGTAEGGNEHTLGDDEDDDDEIDGDDIAAAASGSGGESGAEGNFGPNSAVSSGATGAEGVLALKSGPPSQARRGSLVEAGAARDASSAATTKQVEFADTADSPAAREAISGEVVPEALLRDLRTEVSTLRRRLAAQDADAFVERGMRAGKILDADSLDWRDDYLRDAGAAESRLSRAPVILPPGRMIALDTRGEPTGADALVGAFSGAGVAYGAAALRRGHGGPALRREAAPGAVEVEDLAAYERARVSGRIKEGVAG